MHTQSVMKTKFGKLFDKLILLHHTTSSWQI